MNWICEKNCRSIDVGRIRPQIVTQAWAQGFAPGGNDLGETKMGDRSGDRQTFRFGTSSPNTQPMASFEELAMPVFDSLYNFARWLAHDSTEAEDLVQETYLKALRGFASFERGTNFRAWIFQILRNTFLSSRSRLERRVTVSIDSDQDSPKLSSTYSTPESQLIDRCGNYAVRYAIEQLPVVFREVVLLCDVEDASYREIADILSIPIGTVMSRLARARKAIRESVRDGRGASPVKGSSQERLGDTQGLPWFAPTVERVSTGSLRNTD